MKKEIPEIDSLLEGINDPDAELNPTSPIEKEPSKEDMQHEDNPPIESQIEIPSDPLPESTEANNYAQPVAVESTEKYWNDFMGFLSSSGQRIEKDDRLVCKLDRDLADSLDDCDIGNRCRSDLVNAIIRAFFGTFLPRLIQYKREKRSLLQNYIPV